MSTISQLQVRIEEQAQLLLDSPGHTRLHRVLRSSAAANAATAQAALSSLERMDTSWHALDDSIWSVLKVGAGSRNLPLALVAVWYFYGLRAGGLALDEVDAEAKVFKGIENNARKGLGAGAPSGDFDKPVDRAAPAASFARRRDVAAQLFMRLLEANRGAPVKPAAAKGTIAKKAST
jgi:hypothetical protein